MNAISALIGIVALIAALVAFSLSSDGSIGS